MKKLYSNTLMQLILALCTFSFVACQEFDIDSQPEGPLNIQIDALESYTALATSPSAPTLPGRLKATSSGASRLLR